MNSVVLLRAPAEGRVALKEFAAPGQKHEIKVGDTASLQRTLTPRDIVTVAGSRASP